MSGPQLAPVIILPTTPKASAEDLLRAFTVTRQALAIWRARHGFPAFERQGRCTFTPTAAVAAWVVQRGVAVRWI